MSKGIVLFLLLLIEDVSDSFHGTDLQGTKLANPIGVLSCTSDALRLLLPLFQDSLHRDLLRLAQVKVPREGLNFIIDGHFPVPTRWMLLCASFLRWRLSK